MQLLSRTEEGNEYKFIGLSTIDDWLEFTAVDSVRKSQELTKFYFDWATQGKSWWKEPCDFLAHWWSYAKTPAIVRVLALKIYLGEMLTIDLQSFCKMADEMIVKYNNSILKYINSGKIVAINEYGSMTIINPDEISRYEVVGETNSSIISNDLFYKFKLKEFKYHKLSSLYKEENHE